VIPESFSQLHVTEMSLDRMKRSYIRNAVQRNGLTEVTGDELQFLSEDTRLSPEAVQAVLSEFGVKVRG
jgi:hypothetical protein